MRLFLINFAMLTGVLGAISQPQVRKNTSTVATNDGISIAFDVHGTGTTALVFVHGWSCDRSYWKHQVPLFSQRYKVVTVDLGGHGESGMGRNEPPLRQNVNVNCKFL